VATLNWDNKIMFRICKIHDAVSSRNTNAIEQVQAIIRNQFPLATEKEIQKLSGQLMARWNTGIARWFLLPKRLLARWQSLSCCFTLNYLPDKLRWRFISLIPKLPNTGFCKYCGVHPFANPRAAPDMVSINVHCLDDCESEKVGMEIKPFDGKNREVAIKTFVYS
jgi:hypothetical protein